MSNIRFRALIAIAVSAAGLAAYLFLRSPAAPVEAPVAVGRRNPVGTISPIGQNLYLVTGGGCNTAVFVTDAGVAVVDTKYRESWTQLVSEIRSVTDKPITHIINTHRHPDHSEGNASAPDGVRVVVQANNASKLGQRAETRNLLGSAPITFTDRITLFKGEDSVDVYYFGPAHTDGDSFVVFRSARVMFVGDVMPARKVPVIAVESGGSGATFASVVDQAIAATPDVDRIVTGHGPVVSRQEFQDFADLNHRMLEHVRSSMHFFADKFKAFKSIQLPDKHKSFDLARMPITMDEIDRSIRPRWQRYWPLTR